MIFFLDNIPQTGISYIDELHHRLCGIMGQICEELVSQKNMEKISMLFEQLDEEIRSYTDIRTTCKQKSNCDKGCHPDDALLRFLDMKDAILHFGADAPPSTSIAEIHFWVDNYILMQNQNCISCDTSFHMTDLQAAQ